MMKLRFGYANTHITQKYRGKDDLREHRAQWMKVGGEEPQLEWVHILCHTSDAIAMIWYLERELQHGTTQWDIPKERFFLTFSFEDRFECIDEELQEIKVAIFRTPIEPIACVQPDQSIFLCYAHKCYNVTTKEGQEDPNNISIPQLKEQHEVVGPDIDALEILK